MTIDLTGYLGREQSFIKHCFLTQYLQSAAYKILQGRSPTFNFIDAFAGPWQVSDDTTYSDASFNQALRTLEDVRTNLGKSGIEGLRIRFCFCEKRLKAIDKLRQYAEQHGRFEIHIFHGSFEDHLEGIAAVCSDGFTFTFIDPTGWNIHSAPIFEFLKNQNGEFLLNFMAEHVNRHAKYLNVSNSFGRFLADPDWEDDFNSLPDDWNNERRVLYLLKQVVKSTGAATYLPDFPILKPHENRVKMRLLLGTHSARGLEVFRDVQDKVERTEIETRNQQKNPSGEQGSLFSNDVIVAMQQNAAGIGCRKFQNDAEELIKEFLIIDGPIKFQILAIKILEGVPIRLTQLKKLMNELNDKGVLSFELPHRKRVPQPDTLISLAKT